MNETKGIISKIKVDGNFYERKNGKGCEQCEFFDYDGGINAICDTIGSTCKHGDYWEKEGGGDDD